jgi:hypothetical protein
MTLASRVRRLEQDQRPALDTGLLASDLDVELARWTDALGQVGDLTADAGDRLVALAQGVFNRLGRLVLAAAQGNASGWSPDGLRNTVTQLRRWPKALAAFATTLPDDEYAAVLGDGLARGWLEDYLWALIRCQARVPPDINPDVFLAAVQPWLEVLPPGDHHCFPGVCWDCGLQHPGLTWVGGKYQCRDTPKVCPHCGREGQLWPQGRLREKSFAWIQQAEAELSP